MWISLLMSNFGSAPRRSSAVPLIITFIPLTLKQKSGTSAVSFPSWLVAVMSRSKRPSPEMPSQPILESGTWILTERGGRLPVLLS